MTNKKFGFAVLGTIGGVCLCGSAHANLSSLDTGATQIGGPGGAVIDANWTVALLSAAAPPPEEIPIGGPAGPAFVVPNNVATFPDLFNYWVPNGPSSSWLTYSTPTQTGPDYSGGLYLYQLKFDVANAGAVSISFLSDNSSQLSLNGVTIGANGDPNNIANLAGNTYSQWTTVNGTLNAGLNTLDLLVYNYPYPAYNPTGARVELTGNETPVPEASTMLAGALMLLPLSVSAVRIIRKNVSA